MKLFAKLYDQLETTNDPVRKVDGLTDYLSKVNDQEKLWALALLLQTHKKRLTTTKDLSFFIK